MRRTKKVLLLAVLAATLATGFVSAPARAYLNYHPCRSYMQAWTYSLTCETRSSGGTVRTDTATVPGYPNSVNIGYATVQTFSRTLSLYGGYFTGYDKFGTHYSSRYFVCKADQTDGPYCSWA